MLFLDSEIECVIRHSPYCSSGVLHVSLKREREREPEREKRERELTHRPPCKGVPAARDAVSRCSAYYGQADGTLANAGLIKCGRSLHISFSSPHVRVFCPLCVCVEAKSGVLLLCTATAVFRFLPLSRKTL